MGVGTWKSSGVSQEANQVRPNCENCQDGEKDKVERGLEGP